MINLFFTLILLLFSDSSFSNSIDSLSFRSEIKPVCGLTVNDGTGGIGFSDSGSVTDKVSFELNYNGFGIVKLSVSTINIEPSSFLDEKDIIYTLETGENIIGNDSSGIDISANNIHFIEASIAKNSEDLPSGKIEITTLLSVSCP